MDATGWSHETLAALADTVSASSDLPALARRVCMLVTGTGIAERVSIIAFEQPGGFVALGASDAPAGALATWQAQHREGPSTDASRLRRAVLVPSLEERERQRWPAYTSRALEAGVRSLWSVPMIARDHCVGAMEGHRGHPGPIGTTTVLDAGRLAVVMGVLLQERREYERTARQAGELQAALRNRVLVEQAKGRLAERHRISIEAALDLLSGHAREHGLPLHKVAVHVVEGDLRL